LKQFLVSRSKCWRSNCLHRRWETKQLAERNVGREWGHSNQFRCGAATSTLARTRNFLPVWGRLLLERTSHPTAIPFSICHPIPKLDQNRVLKVDGSWTIKPSVINDASFWLHAPHLHAEQQLRPARRGRTARVWVGSAEPLLQRKFQRWISTTFQSLKRRPPRPAEQGPYTFDYNDCS